MVLQADLLDPSRGRVDSGDLRDAIVEVLRDVEVSCGAVGVRATGISEKLAADALVRISSNT